MTAAVLSIGTELTRGELVNGNAAWLSESLTALGFDVLEQCTVDDDRGRINAAVQRLASTSRVVIATGGLGPTTDDVTTEAVAAALGVPLRRDESSLDRIRKRWTARGLEMPQSNTKQADFPEGADIVPNADGTAPGFGVTLGLARFYFLPGVPGEMRQMFADVVRPAIASLVRRTTHQAHVRTFGMTESQIGDALRDLEDKDDGVLLGYRASFPEIEIKVLARADSETEAETKAGRIAELVRERLKDVVYGDRNDSFPAVVGQALRNRGLTLAVAESCTGGLLGAMLTGVPGSSDYLLMDAVSYANSSKTRMLGVGPEILRAHGAVSSESAVAMAEGALRVGESDLAVALTGIAGPGGGTDDKPVGTVWIALAQRGQPTVCKLRQLHGDRDRVRTLACYIALRMIWRAARGLPAAE